MEEASADHAVSFSARSRNSLALSPRQALPCMQASVDGFVEANGSSIAAFFVSEK
jgi:hypothetical protein